MPKGGKSKKKKEKHQDGGTGVSISPEDDTESVCSSLPDSTISDDVSSDVEDSDSESETQFQLSEHIDQLLDKNSKTRLSALKYLNELLRRRMIAHLLIGREETVSDVLTKGLKKSRGQERCDILMTISLVVLQFGQEQYPLYIILKPLLLAIIKDHTVTPLERSAAVTTLTILCFILSQEFQEAQSIMHECESIIHGVKNDTMVTASIKGWSLLLSITPNHVIPNIISSELPHLSVLLEKSSELSLKIAIGQSIALLMEIARETDESLMDSSEIDVACEVIQSVASESNRYTGRKERTQQRSSFKDLVSATETGGVPERRIKFGTETLQLDSWAKLLQYSAITELLETGTVNHLQYNDVIRDIFQLGPPPILNTKENKAGKIERKLYNAACAKYRSQARGKQRDKRSVL